MFSGLLCFKKNPCSFLLFIICSLFATGSFAQKAEVKPKTDRELTRKIEQAIAGFGGDVGVYVHHIKKNRVVEIQADTVFPTASMVKIPILCGLFDKLHSGQLAYDSVLIYRDSLRYDDGIVGSLRDSAKIPLSYVLMLMETISDNTGSLWMQALAGGGATINNWLQKQGFVHTRVNSRTPGRADAQRTYGWGQTTPREMAELMTLIRFGGAISPDVSERMYRLLGRQFWDGQALSQLPPEIKVAAKNGAVNRAKSEVVYVHAPHGDYVFCITTKNQKDERWKADNEGYVLLRTLSAILWNHFEPRYAWKPLEGNEKWHY
ncbi:serine hydrolase [Arundinibacter roseus]|uniref:Serine hydrolase n=1 Tax=Arundinibacter roseus TaxID=2070510 RepID=A0A4R4KF94_9BACT|nr:serine hydrolase [Arundinibacter roseus]TDB65149.1 serine hydrolase [Arundinibacter roseus]